MSKRVVVIGSGIAGLSAAITLAEQGRACVVLSQAPSERSQSVMAEGGINAVMSHDSHGDSWELHAQETLSAGCYLADPKAVEELAKAAEGLISNLMDAGACFSVDGGGNPLARPFGGQSKNRTRFCGTSTGKQIMSALIARTRMFEAAGLIQRKSNEAFLDVEFQADHVCGVWVYNLDTKQNEFLEADAVIAASGGMNALFSVPTGSTLNDGAVTASLFHAGAALANLEMIQYHPTTVARPGKSLLISEAARGEGARLYTEKEGVRHYFLEEEFGDRGNLAPRDVISRREWDILSHGGQVYLDMTELSPEVFTDRLAGLTELCKDFLHIDPARNPITVQPAVHYFMGGLHVDIFHRSSLKGVYAAGECACQYHGANRLGGNSLLGALYGGKAAALSVCDDFEQEENTEPYAAKQPDWLLDREPGLNLVCEQRKLKEIMDAALGIARDEETLSRASNEIKVIAERAQKLYDEQASLPDNVSWPKQCMLALALIESARARCESRGAHVRSDYPDLDQKFRKTTIARAQGVAIDISFEEIGRV